MTAFHPQHQISHLNFGHIAQPKTHQKYSQFSFFQPSKRDLEIPTIIPPKHVLKDSSISRHRCSKSPSPRYCSHLVRKEGILQAFEAKCQALVATVAITVVVSLEQIDIDFLNLRDFSNIQAMHLEDCRIRPSTDLLEVFSVQDLGD